MERDTTRDAPPGKMQARSGTAPGRFTVVHTESSKGWGGQENRVLHESIGLKKLGARVLILCQP
ncbi:MAG: hypothetical protein NUV75_02390, partial [Gallionella sp.]|nr:hypothetical protein [Gallionella sp.]